ncbi:GNAT family N-acetyltransferase [Desulfatitalea alkaliphila]|uniref:GNAT family N-acetyltransferase n=1 Tax=Desulfatitalea alkaliphila TaxID=2929485 RepID=A0AA41R119_9BACT|nr:GNAT family N-acetyltransferase [Desulfatitalea alkaliphila]MCJ8498941.1 GNAT family N-acetyltransferase [Desulfatitalea alkaliphila]
MTMTIRDARPDDIEPMVHLLQQLFAIETDFAIDPLRHRRGLALLLDGCGKHRCIKVAAAAGEVVAMGSAQTLISTAEGGLVVLVEDIVVDDAWRQQGIGRRIATALEAWALDRGATRLQLLADRTNFDALDFYHCIGWRPTRMICLRRHPTP